MSTSKKLPQRAFVLSLLSNLVSGKMGTAEELLQELTKKIDDTINSTLFHALFGKWERAWGPRLYQHGKPLPVADNVMVVFKSDDTYVVAIAATNSISFYDWFQEDFDVKNKVPFGAEESKAWISKATATGIGHLEAMTSPNSLLDFLSNAPDRTTSKLIYAGHSLAGALSPTLALKQVDALRGAGWTDIRVLPTAGASPGNGHFHDLFTTAFPPVPFETGSGDHWNTVVRNTLDIVPHAWAPLGMLGLPIIYGEAVADVVALAWGALAYAGPEYQYLDLSEFPGSKTGPVDNLSQYMKEAAYQHVRPYLQHFGIPLPDAENPLLLEPVKALEDAMAAQIERALPGLTERARVGR